MSIAGDITLPVVSKIGVVDDVSEQWYQKGVITKLGHPLDVEQVLPAERLSIAQHMAALVASLHEKGIIHGDVKPENFFRQPQDQCLRLVDFSSARMADNSDINSWPADIPSAEYSSPDRQGTQRASSVTDDKFALAVSIWAVFAGEKPMVDLFNSNEGHMPDLTKITEDDMFCAVVDFLREGGLRVDCPGTLARMDTLGVDRTVSFPLSLFDADLDDEDSGATAMKKPHFCAHCFQIAMSNGDKANAANEERPVVYPEFCHLRRTMKHDERTVSDYALEWLQVPKPVTEGHTLGESRKPMLQVKTAGNGEIEKPLWSATSSATIIAPRNKAALPASSESDEGYGTMPEGSSFQRTMSHWSESSFGSCSEDEGKAEWSARLQPCCSFESVALTDDGQQMEEEREDEG